MVANRRFPGLRSGEAWTEAIELLLVDGDNLLHDVRGSRDEGGVAWLLPRLLGWQPDGVRIVVALDGHAAPGHASRSRAQHGIELQHSGSRSADDLIIELLSRQPYAGRARTAVVTRDRRLAERTRQTGGQTRSVDWLMVRLNAASHPRSGGVEPPTPVGIGQGAARRGRRPEAPDANAEMRGPWQPGRGATRKRGNPRHGPKPSRER